jgi:SAM-dependent methyltransferase
LGGGGLDRRNPFASWDPLMTKKEYDSRHTGLDAYVLMAKTFADSPWLHYGMWEPGERVVMPNVRKAQERYVDKFLTLMPPAPAKVLDIGGGTGELAKLLVSKGYEVEVITPSPVQAEEARQKIGAENVHQTFFETFETDKTFDICLFSESFQYIPLEDSLPRMRDLLVPGGVVVITDNFRKDDFDGRLAPGAGHKISEFYAALEDNGLEIVTDEDVTEAVAPSMIIDQDFYRGFLSPLIDQINGNLGHSHPVFHWLLKTGYRLFTSKESRYRMQERLKADYRSPENFKAVNTYRFLAVRPR